MLYEMESESYVLPELSAFVRTVLALVFRLGEVVQEVGWDRVGAIKINVRCMRHGSRPAGGRWSMAARQCCSRARSSE